MKNNIILVGMMGAGKTCIGKALKENLQSMALIDVDEYIEQTQNMKISDIFAKFGELYFRDLETKIINKITKNNNYIISLGGGAFEKSENRAILNQNGFTVYLKAPARVLFDRIKLETHRPLLQQGFGVERVEQILNQRENNYLKALITVETENKSKTDIVEEIIQRVNNYGQ